MTLQRLITLVPLVVMCSLLEARAAQVTVSQTICSDGTAGGTTCGSGISQTSSSSGSGVSHSSSTGSDGVTNGECSYYNQQGVAIKIKYQILPDGSRRAEAENTQNPPLDELDRCLEAAQVGQVESQQVFDQVQAEHQQLQENLQRQSQQIQEEIQLKHQRLQEEIRRQQEAIFSQNNSPLPLNFNPIQFHNFRHGGFGPQF